MTTKEKETQQGASCESTLLALFERLRQDVTLLQEAIVGRGSSSPGVSPCEARQGAGPMFFPFMEEMTRRLMRQGRIGTAKNRVSALESFRRFRGGEDVSLCAMDSCMMEEYQLYLQSRKLARNSISFYMRILRTVYNVAVRQGLVVDRKPFSTVYVSMESTRKRALGQRDIRRIHDLDLSDSPGQMLARDLFIFLFLCRGMSFVDAALLKKRQIQGGRISYRRMKTGRPLQIKLTREMREIIERHTESGSPYVFPLVSSEKDERRQYENSLRRINQMLKTVGVKAKLKVPLTTHVGRHTWATIAKSKHIPLSVISDALGHDSERTTSIYLDSIDSAVLDHANEVVSGVLTSGGTGRKRRRSSSSKRKKRSADDA